MGVNPWPVPGAPSPLAFAALFLPLVSCKLFPFHPFPFGRCNTVHSATLGAVCTAAGKLSRFGTVNGATLGTACVYLRLQLIFILFAVAAAAAGGGVFRLA